MLCSILATRASFAYRCDGAGSETPTGRAGGRRASGGLDGAATRAGRTHHHAGDEHDDHGPNDRGHDRRDVERAVDRVGAEQRAGEEAADERADDAEHDVPDDTQTLVTLDEEPGEIPGNGAEHDPRDDAHGVKPPSLHARTGALG